MAYASAAPVQPQYQSYQTAQVDTPTYQYVGSVDAVAAAQPTYINVGNAWGYSTTTVASAAPMPAAPAPGYYQPATYQPAQPTYIDSGVRYGAMAPVYDTRTAGYAPVPVYHQPAPAPVYQSYNVAYAQPMVIFGSAFPHHAR